MVQMWKNGKVYPCKWGRNIPEKRGSQECATPDSPGRVYCTCRHAQASVYLISLSELVTVVDNLCILYKVGECGL